jgi:chaperone modulatory protein CbpM
MQVELHNVVWLDSSQHVSVQELVDLSGLAEDEVIELVAAGALEPRNYKETPWTFSGECVVTVRRASRLRDDLELDHHALALALALLEQIRALEARVANLQAQLPRFAGGR